MRRLMLSLLFLVLIQAPSVLASNFPRIPLEAALKRASAEGKNVLVYFTARWCAPCKRMDRLVFPDSAVKAELEKRYVPIEIDGESVRGEALRNEFNIAGFPTFLIVNADRVVQQRRFGYLDVKRFMNFVSTSPDPAQDAENLKIEQYILTRQASQKTAPALSYGLKLGPNISRFTNYSKEWGLGYEAGAFVALETKRLLLRPGLNMIEKGGAGTSRTYVQFPLDIGLNLYKGSVFGRTGGYRVIASPYTAVLLNKKRYVMPGSDHGVKLGLSAFIGKSKQSEFILSSDTGVKDVNSGFPGKQRNQTFGFQLAFTL
ncbi:thioredoxin family protein [Daejeonella lutea]|nr:thioredoxin family protein [Daejeonella lutea]